MHAYVCGRDYACVSCMFHMLIRLSYKSSPGNNLLYHFTAHIFFVLNILCEPVSMPRYLCMHLHVPISMFYMQSTLMFNTRYLQHLGISNKMIGPWDSSQIFYSVSRTSNLSNILRSPTECSVTSPNVSCYLKYSLLFFKLSVGSI